MDTLRELLSPKTFNRISYVAVFCWILYGVILLGIFAEMENSDSFRCEAKLERMDLVRVKCSDQYNKQYNKSGVPLYGFVIANFSLIGIVCVIYSQVVKSRVDELLTDTDPRRDDEGQNNDRNRPKRRKLFVAYFCQLAIRFLLGIVFIVLQIQFLYPANFPSEFLCQIAGDSHAAIASSTDNIQNNTMYECHNQQATKKTSWMYAVIVGNGLLALIILIELICILALRAKIGKEFLEDWQFLKHYLPPQEPQEPVSLPQETPQELEWQDSQQEENGEIPLGPLVQTDSEEQQLQQPSLIAEFTESLKKSIIEGTDKPPDLKALIQKKHGEGKRNEDRKIDNIYTNLVLIPDTAQYEFTGNRHEQLKVFPRPKENVQSIRREDVVNAEHKKILIVGRPGIGKTLFFTKFFRDWALGRVFNAELHFAVAFFLKFRKFNSEGELSLRELLARSEYSQTEGLSEEVWSYILRNPDKVLILFDGLDEFSDFSSIANQPVSKSGEEAMPLSALYYNIVEENLLPGATVLTTTRPTTVSYLTDLHFRRTFEILGFSSQQIEEYVAKFTKDEAKDVKDTGGKIWEHIKTNMNIFSLCYIPVNSFIVCSCLLQVLKFNSEEGSTSVGLPTKLTEIYQRAMKLFFFRHNEQYRDKPLSRKEIGSKDLPPEVEEKFKPLAKLAFDGLAQRKLIFGTDEVGDDLVRSDLFHQLPDRQTGPFTYEAQFCFIHLTMQEFLAAKHITDTMKGAELRKFVADHINKGEWLVVIQFVAGLLGDGDEQSLDIFTDLLPKTTEEKDESELMFDDSEERRTVTCWPTRSEKHLAVTLMKCLYENNASNSIVQSKLEEIGFNAVDLSNCRLAPADCTAVVHFLKSFKQISLINLSYNNIGSLGCVEIVKLFDNGNCNLSSLNLGLNDITDQGIKHLCKALEQDKCNLSSLNLGDNNITDQGIKHLCKALEQDKCNLSSLNLEGNNITDKSINHLSKALVNNNKLRRLTLFGNPITNKARKQIREANPNCLVLI